MDGAIIKAARKQAKVTQEELAEYLGVNRATISKYESNAISPSFSQIEKISLFLRIPITKLIESDLQTFDTPADFEKKRSEMIQVPGEELCIAHCANGVSFSFKPGTDCNDPVNYQSKLLAHFNALTTEGQSKAVEWVSDLAEIPKYRK